ASETFFFQAEDGIRDFHVTGVQTCALPISPSGGSTSGAASDTPTPVRRGASAAGPGNEGSTGNTSTVGASGMSMLAASGFARARSEERRVGHEWPSGGGTRQWTEPEATRA